MSVKIHLAPMEGVLDFILRDIICSAGGIDRCVTEFIRVTDKLLPEHIFYRMAPELKWGSQTKSGTELYIQLLGGQASPLADNAALAASLGAKGIDLNFGCPAKTVNRHDGGASLLKSSDRLYNIVNAVRAAVPANIPVTAKMRLGFDSAESCIENSQALSEGGASLITVHCRTKTDGYRPPAYWDWIPKIREVVKIPIVANGEIWDIESFQKCYETTNCDQFMIGRGLIADPFLATKIKKMLLSNQTENTENWENIKSLIPDFFSACAVDKSPYFAQARTKQWLRTLSLRHPQAKSYFDELKTITNPLIFQSKFQSLILDGSLQEH